MTSVHSNFNLCVDVHMGLDPPSTCVHLSLTPLRVDVINGWPPTKLFIATLTLCDITTPLRFRVRFKTLYCVIQSLIQHCLLRRMVYLNIIYVIATRNYDFFTTGIVP